MKYELNFNHSSMELLMCLRFSIYLSVLLAQCHGADSLPEHSLHAELAVIISVFTPTTPKDPILQLDLCRQITEPTQNPFEVNRDYVPLE